jgi:hypothetical protein
MNDWLSDVFFNWPAAEAAYDFSDDAEAQLLAVARDFLIGCPIDVTPEELTEDFISRV